MSKKTILVCMLLAACGFVISSCVIHARPHPVVVVGPPVEYGYQPLLYDGYVVYYADDGVPYYWLGGARVWIPDHARARYVAHWRANRRSYRSWRQHRGKHYRNRRYRKQGKALKKARKKPKLKPKRDDDEPKRKSKRKKKHDDDHKYWRQR
jgi:hypothetical protein